MNILFIHQNFPGQFKFLAPALVQEGHNVTAMTMQKIQSQIWQGVQLIQYGATRSSSATIHPWVADFETKIIRAEACARKAWQMLEEGYIPDVIIAHHGWGESLFLKEVWPKAKLGIYCEFFYLNEGADSNFDPEFPTEDALGARCRLHMKNVNNFLHFDIANAGISPTKWQASTFPEPFRSKITVVHDGIDTDHIKPNMNARVALGKGTGEKIILSKDDEIITFVNRNLEPMRGFHIFMRALPELLKKCPNAKIIIVGGDGVSYGAKPTKEVYGASSWKEIFIKEVRSKIDDSDWQRVNFVGKVPYDVFLSLLQLSSVHIYLTYPFVLSWSLIEAMSASCAIVASNTKPLSEVIEHNETGRLIDFFDTAGLVDEVFTLLKNPEERNRLGKNAREFAVANYDLKKVCLPRQLSWVDSLAEKN